MAQSSQEWGGIQQLVEMLSVSQEEAASLLKTAKGDVTRAVDDYMEAQRTSSVVPIGEVTPIGPQNAPSKEDQEFQAAIKASLQDSEVPASASTNGVFSKVEQEIALAIEQSLMERGGVTIESTNPHDRVRNKELPPGLKNIGNTCYVNSLVQMYYYLPEFRRAVLTFVPTPDDFAILDRMETTEDKQQNALRFMYEVQRLFGFLTLSNRKMVDLTRTLSALLDDANKPFAVGNQQDIGEFNVLFLNRMEEAFALHRDAVAAAAPAPGGSEAAGSSEDARHGAGTADGAGTQTPMQTPMDTSSSGPEKPSLPNIIKTLFYGQTVNIFAATESDGAPVEAERREEFAQLMLNVAPDLYGALDLFTEGAHVEFTTPGGHATQAVRTTWFDAFPPVLTVQVQRSTFDRNANDQIKVNDRVNFDAVIYLDRYHVRNREETSGLRLEVAETRRKLESVEAKLREYTHFKGRDMALDRVLGAGVDFLDDRVADAQGEERALVEQFRQYMANSLASVEATIAALREQSSQLQNEIAQRFSHMRSFPYRLHGVLVHSGGPKSGHYWAFLRDPHSHTWTNFNDSNVARVSELEVFADSLSTRDRTSWYCLVYVDARRDLAVARDAFGEAGVVSVDGGLEPSLIATPRPDTVQSWIELVPPALQALVAADNASLAAECEKWDEARAAEAAAAALAPGDAVVPAISVDVPATARPADIFVPARTPVEAFVAAYQGGLDVVAHDSQLCRVQSPPDDHRVRSMEVFLHAFDQHESALYRLVETVRATSPQLSDAEWEEAKQVLKDRFFVTYDGPWERKAEFYPIMWKGQYSAFCKATYHFVVACQHIAQSRIPEALDALVGAWVCDSRLASRIRTPRRQQIRMLTQRMLRYVTKVARESMVRPPAEILDMIHKVGTVLSVVFPEPDPVRTEFVSSWVQLASAVDRSAFTSDERAELALALERLVGDASPASPPSLDEKLEAPPQTELYAQYRDALTRAVHALVGNGA